MTRGLRVSCFSSTGAEDQEEGSEASTESDHLDLVTVKSTTAPHTEVNEEREQEKEEEREEITSTVSPAEVLETLTPELPRSSDTGLRNYQDHHKVLPRYPSTGIMQTFLRLQFYCAISVYADSLSSLS